MAERDDVRWGLAQRFEMIEWRAYWLGRVNRSDLEERFGVSTPQASVDLRAYQEAAPGNIEYDSTQKAYVPKDTFQPKFLRLSSDRYLAQLNAILNGAILTTDTWFKSPPPATVMKAVVRSVRPATLRAILRAIEDRQELEIEYQSLKNSRRRFIAPHAIAFDGQRWHTRAWCTHRREFRDFVLTRIQSVGESRSSISDPTNDVEWNTIVKLKIVPHPRLSEAGKAAIAMDYGMESGQFVLETRAALAFYLIKHLNLDLEGDNIAPERQQISLTNLAEVEEACRAAKEKMLALVAHLAQRVA
jgi:predicted DNA-binding transcriptional regulator YafY